MSKRSIIWSYEVPKLKPRLMMFLPREQEIYPNLGSSWDSNPYSYHYATWTPGRGAEDKLHKQHCLEASAEFQLIFTLSRLENNIIHEHLLSLTSNLKPRLSRFYLVAKIQKEPPGFMGNLAGDIKNLVGQISMPDTMYTCADSG